MRRFVILAIAGVSIALFGIGACSAASEQDKELEAVRSATEKFESVEQATAAGYEPFYVCTEEPGVGTMGQHYVNGGLVEDPAVDPLRPEALVYEPADDGGSRLVAVEYVVLAPTLPAGASAPAIFGEAMTFVPGSPNAENRYGLPDFYQRHAWIFENNPLGKFNDWNPDVSCGGNGDGGG